MGKYSLVGFCTSILYGNIYRIHMQTVNLSYMSLILLLTIYQTNNKKVFKDFQYQKFRMNITAHKSCKNCKSKKILKGVVETKP